MGTQDPTYDAETGEMIVNEKGQEVPDPTPMAPPVGYVKQQSLAEQIREMVRSEKLRLEVEQQGLETFEEADDFDVGDDYDPSSPYENEFDPPISELATAGEQILAEKAKSTGGSTPNPSATASGDKASPSGEDPKPSPKDKTASSSDDAKA